MRWSATLPDAAALEVAYLRADAGGRSRRRARSPSSARDARSKFLPTRRVGRTVRRGRCAASRCGAARRSASARSRAARCSMSRSRAASTSRRCSAACRPISAADSAAGEDARSRPATGCRCGAPRPAERDEVELDGFDLTPPARFRVIPGPQSDHFSERRNRGFFSGDYTRRRRLRSHGNAAVGPPPRHTPRLQYRLGCASRPARSRFPATASRSCCSPTGRPPAAIRRSRPSSRPTCRRSAAWRSAPGSRSSRSRVEAAEAARRRFHRRDRVDRRQDRAACERTDVADAAARMQPHQRRRRRRRLRRRITRHRWRCRCSRAAAAAVRPDASTLPAAARPRDVPAGRPGRRQAHGQRAARHSLHDRRDRPVRDIERDREMAGRDLSGRRGDVLPLVLVAPRLRRRRAAVRRVFRCSPRTRPGAHIARGLSQSISQTFTVIAFSLMPLAGAIAINFSAPLWAALLSVLWLKERAGPARWTVLLTGFCGVLIVTNPGADSLQIGALFALANAMMYGSVTVAVRGMTKTESAEHAADVADGDDRTCSTASCLCSDSACRPRSTPRCSSLSGVANAVRAICLDAGAAAGAHHRGVAVLLSDAGVGDGDRVFRLGRRADDRAADRIRRSSWRPACSCSGTKPRR